MNRPYFLLALILVPPALLAQTSFKGGGSAPPSLDCNFPCGDPGYPQNMPTSGALAWTASDPFSLNSLAYNSVFTDPTTGVLMVACTDDTHSPGSGSQHSSWVTNAGSFANAWSGDSAWLAVSNAPDSQGKTYLINFNWSNFVTGGAPCGTSYGATDFNTAAVFGRTSAHTLYGGLAGVGVDFPWGIYSCSNPSAGTHCMLADSTLLFDEGSGSTFPSIPTLTSTTNATLTLSNDEQTIASYGNGAQDSASIVFMARKISGTWQGMWLEMATGSIHTSAGFTGAAASCTGCIPSSFRTGGAGAGIHLVSVDADGDGVEITNQNNSTGYEHFTISTGQMAQGTTASPSQYAGHFCFALGDYVFNGQGNTANVSGNLGFRIRSFSSPDTTYSDLLSSFNFGQGAGGSVGSHQNCNLVGASLSGYMAAAQFFFPAGMGLVANPLQQELDLIGTHAGSQQVLRVANHQAQYALGSRTNSTGAVGNGTTLTLTTIGNHDIQTGNTVNVYGCLNGSANGTGLSATRTSSTVLTVPSSFNGTTGCRVAAPSANLNDFWGSSLVECAPNARGCVVPTSWGGTTPPDLNDNNGCNSDHCNAKEILVMSTLLNAVGKTAR